MKSSLRISMVAILLAVYSVVGANDNPWAEPIWKSPPVPENPEAEFDSHDPYGLSIGVYIKTDCSIRMVWHIDKKLYCFNSLTSKAFFLDNPKHYIDAASAYIDPKK